MDTKFNENETQNIKKEVFGKDSNKETTDKWQEIDEAINKGFYEIIDYNDIDREGSIIDLDLVQTRYGEKIVVLIDFKNEIKNAFVTRGVVRQWVKNNGLNSTKELLGKRVKIVKVIVQTKKGYNEKAVPHLVGENNEKKE